MPTYRALFHTLLLIVAAAFLAGCNEQYSSNMRAYTPIPQRVLDDMAAKDMTPSSPILVRVYKQEAEFEIWKKTNSGRFALLKSYPICRWSGQLGPKKTEGDRQVPEGFYSVSQSQLNPNSNYYLSYDVGFPNAVDRSLGRSGGDIMVHGVCSSRGCFAMTNDQMGEIYAITREAMSGGQASFQFQSFPFRMTAENMARNRKNPNVAFWNNLKQGADTFEVTKTPVEIAACDGHYVFDGQGGASCGIPAGDPMVTAAVNEKRQRDDATVASLVNSGTQAVATLYEDGGENQFFKDRTVSNTAIPGIDIPYNAVTPPTVVALDNSGHPATPADATAANNATYSAAEMLLMSEAAVAHRQTGPENPSTVAKRQVIVYSRLMGDSMPAVQVADAAPVKPMAGKSPKSSTPNEIAPGAVELASTTATDDQPFYVRLFKFGGSSSESAQQADNAAVPVDTTATAVAGADSQPFYKRLFNLNNLGWTSATDAPPVVQAATPVIVPPPLPPHDPRVRTAVLPKPKNMVAEAQ